MQVALSGPKITDVVAVQLTNSNRTSVQISASAAPILRQEALQAQSAQIDTVSGATYTSEGYQQSLQAALDAAHA
ncbi:MAG TPA: FMN-binding protein [Lapillicoccus sp.]|uniref:FMN-binding protein n=1 Tax=Lapillicoccus sp. TaxID=1909287 RepID=UPI002F92792F